MLSIMVFGTTMYYKVFQFPCFDYGPSEGTEEGSSSGHAGSSSALANGDYAALDGDERQVSLKNVPGDASY